MALGELLKGTTKSSGKKRGWITARKIRGRRRYCVVVDVGKKTPGFKGRGSTKRFYGCYVEKSKATSALARRVSARGGSRKRRKSRRRRRR